MRSVIGQQRVARVAGVIAGESARLSRVSSRRLTEIGKIIQRTPRDLLEKRTQITSRRVASSRIWLRTSRTETRPLTGLSSRSSARPAGIGPPSHVETGLSQFHGHLLHDFLQPLFAGRVADSGEVLSGKLLKPIEQGGLSLELAESSRVRWKNPVRLVLRMDLGNRHGGEKQQRQD